jgi:photosystem II stability/assembly factor-like uncharacterized protein
MSRSWKDAAMSPIDRRRWLAGALAATALPWAVEAQTGAIEALDSGVADELRGLSLAGGARWASGAKGCVTADNQVVRPPGAEGLDFRGIHAFSARSALAMSAGRAEASQLWRTDDAGKTWTRITVNTDPQGFWDAIAFADAKRGFILGDPTAGRFTLLRTQDGGQTWARAPDAALPPAYEGEAAFAASNGSLAIGPKGLVAFCTGGLGPWARAYVSRDGGQNFVVIDAPIEAKLASRGGFACAFDRAGTLWVCGGDYRAPKAEGVNLARLTAGSSAFEAVAAPAGYLSGVAARDGTVIATGLAGTIVSLRGGPFVRLSETPFNTARLRGAGEAHLVGPKGSMGRWRA